MIFNRVSLVSVGRSTTAEFAKDPFSSDTSVDDAVQQLCVEVMAINKYCNDTLFPSKERTSQLIQSGEYIESLQKLYVIFRTWQDRLQNSQGKCRDTSSSALLTTYSAQAPKDPTLNRGSILPYVYILIHS